MMSGSHWQQHAAVFDEMCCCTGVSAINFAACLTQFTAVVHNFMHALTMGEANSMCQLITTIAHQRHLLGCNFYTASQGPSEE
jgi:hypothetical protein